MKYKVNRSLISNSWFEGVLHKTLKMYDAGEDVYNSPLIEFQRNWENGE